MEGGVSPCTFDFTALHSFEGFNIMPLIQSTFTHTYLDNWGHTTLPVMHLNLHSTVFVTHQLSGMKHVILHLAAAWENSQ